MQSDPQPRVLERLELIHLHLGSCNGKLGRADLKSVLLLSAGREGRDSRVNEVCAQRFLFFDLSLA